MTQVNDKKLDTPDIVQNTSWTKDKSSEWLAGGLALHLMYLKLSRLYDKKARL